MRILIQLVQSTFLVNQTNFPIDFSYNTDELSSETRLKQDSKNQKFKFVSRFPPFTILNIYFIPCAFCLKNFFMIIFVSLWHNFAFLYHKFLSYFTKNKKKKETHIIFFPSFAFSSSAYAFTFISIDKYFSSCSVAFLLESHHDGTP